MVIRKNDRPGLLKEETSKTSSGISRSGQAAASFEIEDDSFIVYPFTGNAKISANSSIADKEKVVGELKTRHGRFIVLLQGSAEDSTRKTLSPSVDVLTKREHQIATLVAEGRVNKEIAAGLGISEWTVSTHLRRMFAKLGVDNRAALVYRCFGMR